MNHLIFLPYHNKLIKFRYSGEWKIGVVLDEIPYNRKKKSTEYIYIPSENLAAWRTADRTDDQKAKEGLQEVIDILNISEADFFRPQMTA